MTKKTSNVVSMRRRSNFATAADTFDIDALIGELDGRGANSGYYGQADTASEDLPGYGMTHRFAA